MAEDTTRTIFTLEARGNSFWEVATEVFKLSEQQVFRQINLIFGEFQKKLALKQLDYLSLKPALMNFDSYLKTHLSTVLVRLAIKHKGVVLMGHEDDRDDTEDVNMSGYAWEENGYVCRSIQGLLFGIFLSYKIERAVFGNFQAD